VIGKKFGHYLILEKIGTGGMGEVYRAHDEQLDRDVALKVLLPRDLGDETARARLLREARAAAGLNHPHICIIHDVGELEGQAYIAMEYVEGRSLSALIAQERLPHEQALRYGVQLAEALAHAHAHGVVHRDLKSANVIVTSEGQVKVLDFGLAKRLNEGDLDATLSQASLTQPGAVVGTLAYMAPEQLRGQPADGRTDIWALGIVLYEMVAGGRPFRGQTGYELSSAILNRRPAPPPGEVPAALRAAIEHCMEKEPDRRYQRADEVRAALEAVHSAGTTAQLLPQRAGARRPHTVSRKRIRALAVLPLTNLSRDPEQEYFADGMTEALISALAKLQALRVISRTSAMRYKATDKSLPEIAGELRVDAVVEGSVLRVGQKVRITAQLIQAATDTHLWAESYERDLQDVLLLQSEVARTIAREIQVAITPEETRRLASARAVNPEAYEAYLKGRFHWYKLSREHLDNAERYFQLALEKDPNYALAYSGLADVWMSRGDTGFMSRRETADKANAAARKALELDDNVADAHIALGNMKAAFDWEWVAAETEFQRAIQLNPNNANAHFMYADFLISQKRVQEWQREIDRALELDPMNFFAVCFYGWHLMYVGRYDEAIQTMQKAAASQDFSSVHMGLWCAYHKKEMDGEALQEAKRFFSALHDSEAVDVLEKGYSAGGYRMAVKCAADVLAARSSSTHVSSVRIARLYAHAGENGQALDWLEKAYRGRESPLVHLAVARDWDDLRANPRFQDLLLRLNLPS
jgi:eukaryotic-like serine/threonine-protein kinase